jgi:hypothetical protein
VLAHTVAVVGAIDDHASSVPPPKLPSCRWAASLLLEQL